MDYGKDDDLLWIVFLQKNGECWIYSNPQIRACPNITFGRMQGTTSDEVSRSIKPRPAKRPKNNKLEKALPTSFEKPRHSQNGHGVR